MRLSRMLVLSLLFAAGCAVEPVNPFDPSSSNPAKGVLTGRVVSEAGDPLVDAFVRALSEGAEPVPVPVAPDGLFQVELAPGLYAIEAGAAAHFASTVTGLRVFAGAEGDIGVVRLTVVRGTVTGTLRLVDGGSPAGATVTLVPTESSLQAFSTTAGPDGEYRVDEVPEGEYVVRAAHLEYAPGYTEEQTVDGEGQTQFSELTLQPASAVVRVEVDGRIGARYTNTPSVRLLLLAFGDHVTEMMLSEDPTFEDAAKGDTDWRQYAASVDATLSADDGTKTLYARFRDNWGIESPAFTTSIVLDRTAPTITSATLGDGSGWGRALAAQTPLAIEASDALSGIASFVIATDGELDTEAPEPREANPGAATIATSTDLGTVAGPKTVLVRVSDAAGNLSELTELEVVVDALPPITGTPALVVDGGASVVNAREVTVSFDVSGDSLEEPLFYVLANASGTSVEGPFEPLPTTSVPWSLSDGVDGLRTLCARFRDAAGNVTEESCVDLTLDRTGRVAGAVSLEDAGAILSGVTVTVTSEADPGFTAVATTSDDGTFNVGGLPAGSAYVVRVSVADYETATVRPVSVFAGQTTTLDTQRLKRARGSLSGVVTLNDRAPGESGGIVIAAANSPYAVTTTPVGAFLLRDLPVGSYEIVARAQGYLAASFGTVTVQAGQEQDLGSLQLRRQSGSFAVCRAGDVLCAQGPLSFTGSRDVLLNLTSTTATQYRAGTSEDLSGVAYAALEEGQTTYPFELDDVDGAQTIFVQYRTGEGEEQTPLSSSVTLDREAPTAFSVVIDPDAQGQGAAWSRHATGLVRLALAAEDALSGVASVIVSNDATLDEQPLVFAPTVTHRVDDAVDGSKTVYVGFCDRVGNCTDPGTPATATITLDRVAPSVAQGYAMQLAGGAAVTASGQVSVDVTLGEDAASVRFGTTPTLAGASWLAVDAESQVSFSLLLPLGEGTKTVYAQFADAAGNLSGLDPAAFTDDIVLDTLAPDAPKVTVPGNGYTNASFVDVEPSANAAVAMQVVAGSSEDFSGASWEAITATHRVNLTSDGLWKIFARFRDAAGNVSSTATGQIIRDTVAPIGQTLEIVESPYATSQQVNLRLFASGADEMRVSSDGAFDAELWEPYAPAKAFSLVPVDASPYTVRAVFRDRAGNESAEAFATVGVDPVPPTVSLKLNDAASGGRTNTADVIASITASDDVELAGMQLSNDPSFAGSVLTSYSDTASWRVEAAGPDGLRTVYVRVFDAAGNGATASATITLDRAAPTGTVTFREGARTNTRAVTLDLTRDAEVTHVAFADGVLDCAAATYETWPASNAKSWTLPTGDGAKTVVACFRDASGNASSASASITLDETAPLTVLEPAVRINDGATHATQVGVTLDLRVAGADTMRVSCDDALDAEPSQPFQSSLSCNLNPTQGTRTVTATFADLAGNVLGPVTAIIVLDTLLPPAPVAGVVATPTSAATTSLGWTSGGGDTTAFRVQVSSSATFAALAVDESTSATSFDWMAPEGTWSWRVAALDLAGNQSEWSATGSFRVDRTAPQAPRLALASTAGDSVTVTWRAPGDDGKEGNLATGSTYDLRWMPKGAPFAFAGANQAAGEPTPAERGADETFVLEGLSPKSTYNLALRVCDAAANCSEVSPVLVVATGDDVPPSAIADLSGVVGDHSVMLRWTNSGDDGASGGSVHHYAVSYRAGPLVTEDDFALAQRLIFAAGAPGTQAQQTIGGLSENTEYSFAVRAYDAAGNDSGPSNVVVRQMTRIDDVRPPFAQTGDWIELHGLNFGATQAAVSFNGVQADRIGFWSNTLVRVQVPEHASSGEVRIVRGVSESSGQSFKLSPRLTSVYPREVLVGDSLYLAGSHFGDKSDNDTGVSFGDRFHDATKVNDWQDGAAAPKVEATIDPGLYQVRVSHEGHSSRAEPVRVWSVPTAIPDGDVKMLGLAGSRADGSIQALFVRRISDYEYLYLREMAEGATSWGSLEATGGYASPGTSSFSGDIDIDMNGKTHICWVSRYAVGTTRYTRIYYKSRAPDGTWGSTKQLKASSTTSYQPWQDCKIAASVQGGAAAVLVVWTEGYWNATLQESRLYGSGSVDDGATFSTPVNICPNGGCSGNNFEGVHDVAAVDGYYLRGWHLVFGRKSSVSGDVDLRVAWASAGSVATPFTFEAGRRVRAGLASAVQPVMATVTGYSGWYRNSHSVVSWMEGNALSSFDVWLARVGGGTLLQDLDQSTYINVDQAAYEHARPRLSATSDGDLSVFVTGDAQTGTGGGHVVRHHTLRWRGADPVVLEGGHEIAGIESSGLLFSASGAHGRVALAWREAEGAGVFSTKASWSRLPRLETTDAQVLPAPASTYITSPETTIAADGTSRTVYWEEATYSPYNVALRVVEETAKGLINSRPDALGAGVAYMPCSSGATCRDATAVATLPDGRAAVLFAPPNPGLRMLSLCVDLMSCTPLKVASGTFEQVALAADPGGALHLVYARSTGELHYRRWANGKLGPELVVNALPNGVLEAGQAMEPAVVASPSGTAFVFYRRIYGLNTLRVRSITHSAAAPGGFVRSLPVELAASASSIERPSAAWGANGITLAWRAGGRRVMRGSWLDGWLEAPVEVTDDQNIRAWTALVDASGQTFVYLDTVDGSSYDWYAATLDLDRLMSAPVTLGPASDTTRGYTSVAVDPRGRLVMHRSCDFGCGPLTRATFRANE